jgi:hypothetical protein
VRLIEVTPIERDERRTPDVAIIFAFEPESSFACCVLTPRRM